jgi:hypothetical protein
MVACFQRGYDQRHRTDGHEAVSVMKIARRTLLGLIAGAGAAAVSAGPAVAQFPMPSINLEQDRHRTPEEIEHDRAIDNAYRSAAKKIPDKKAVNDPWADVRPTAPAAPGKKKQQVSQEKKHAE